MKLRRAFTATALLAACSDTANLAPMARLADPGPLRVKTTATFDATGSLDPDGVITGFRFDFGDGSDKVDGASMVAHTFEKEGTYTVRVRVQDDQGGEDTAGVQVVVAANLNPVPVLSGPTTALVGEPLTFDTIGSSDADGVIVKALLDFGDGNTAEAPAASHAFLSAGTYTVTATLTDNDGGATSVARVVTVRAFDSPGRPPVASFTAPASSGVNSLVTLDASATSAGSDPIRTIQWSLGDGRTMSGTSLVNVTYAAPGTYTVTLTVTSASGLTSQAVRQLTITQNFVAAVGVSPASGSADGGTLVTITGSNFDAGANAVTFGGKPGTQVTVVDPNHLTVRTPAVLAPGTVDVVVSNNAGWTTLSNAFTFATGGATATRNFGWIDATTGGTALGVAAGADDTMFSFTLPFEFPFYARRWAVGSTVYVCTNGWLSFYSVACQAGRAGIPSASNPDGLIAPFFYDLLASSTAGSDIYWKVTGTAPNRVLTVEWVAFTDFTNGAAAQPFTFEINLYEGTGDVKFQYMNQVNAPNAQGQAALIGLQADSATGLQASLSTAQNGLAPGGKVFVFHNTASGYVQDSAATLSAYSYSPVTGQTADTGMPFATFRFTNPVALATAVAGGNLVFNDLTEPGAVAFTPTWNGAQDVLTYLPSGGNTNYSTVWRGHSYLVGLQTTLKDSWGNFFNQTPNTTPTALYNTVSASRYGKVSNANATNAYRVAYSNASGRVLVGSRGSAFTWFNYSPNSFGGTTSGNVGGGNIFTLAIDSTGGTGYAGTNGGVYQLNTNGSSSLVGAATRVTGLVATANDLVLARPTVGTLRRMTYGGGTNFTSPNLTGSVNCPGAVTLGNPVLAAVDNGDLVYTVTDQNYLAQFSTDVQTCNWNTQLAGISNTISNDTLAIRNNNELWVTAGTNGVYVYSTAGAQLSGSPIAVPFAQDVAFSPNGAYAFVTNPNSGQIAVINTATRAIVGQYEVAGGKAEYLATLNAVATGLQPKVRLFVTDGATVFQTQ